ncbi:hypothetical protein [Halobacterium salinarum]|uniref:Uncharacterized protein n=2 Tax=Halobacterium salinarum TaxID=2242 RepID=Q9HSI3_HALSA|nr:hypothetical protein [Halobacterium salinarum]AAG18823.1 hypothetical protein VNG_0216H [Halobacterium salinarum NRC-1]MBB6090754.1 hypothetical protein [Halobacterium salinarum]MDL0142297.1 hypothetical protein [Halobacterium salinarum]UEB92243.1 hypothetical protein LJ422_00995 [Halobacterium salinarum NRC-34001]DAC77508.1 TPA_inf: uncharacterized protein VNG_0216H [Halobacterium salinarum NRC-1]
MSVKQEYNGSNDIEATARVNTDSDGDVLGACLFLGSDELAELGLKNSEQIGYTIENGQLQLRGVAKDGK